MRVLTVFLITCGFAFIALFVLVRYLEAKGVFFPNRQMAMNPSALRLDWEDVTMTTKDGVAIHGWLIKNPKATSIILYHHGNAGNISDRIMKMKFFHDLGFAVFIYDYRGFGLSEGKPSERGVYLDAQAAYDWIKQNQSTKNLKLIDYGTSLGGIVAVDLAVNRSVDCLIVDSSITSAKAMARRMYPFIPTFMTVLRFDSLAKIPFVKAPVLIMHSRDDQTIPFFMGEALFRAATEPKVFIAMHGGHNDAQISNDPLTIQSFINFLKQYGFIQ